jgi:hypothetical protein
LKKKSNIFVFQKNIYTFALPFSRDIFEKIVAGVAQLARAADL